MLLLTIGFQYMRDQFIVDLHKLLVDLFVIFGILVPDQTIVIFGILVPGQTIVIFGILAPGQTIVDLKVYLSHLLITLAASAQAFKAALKSLCL